MKSYSDYIVNCKALKSNALKIKNLIGDVKFCAVVKANAYGVGVATVCKELFGIADFFAVANLKEALGIRIFDKTTKIIILGVVDTENLDLCAQNNISISVPSLAYLHDYANICKNRINIHLQINTGLNRFGIRKIGELKTALKIIRMSQYINLEGIYSHFATKDKDVSYIKKQFIRFNQFRKYVDSNVICHMANSFATTYDRKFHMDMVRNGFLLYGASINSIENKPVISIKSRIINIIHAQKGDTIGYDRTFSIKKSSKIAVVPIGYADGLDRKLSNNFSVLINGEYCPIVGMICMDVFMVDIGNLEVCVGDEVVLLGSQKGRVISLQDYANALKTSSYEIMLKFNYKRMNYIVESK